MAPSRTGPPRLVLRPLVPGGQPAGLPGLEHALRVRVPPPRRIALRRDQDVLAEGRQEPAAQRTAIRRRFAILRPANRPPGRLHELRHGQRSSAMTTSTMTTIPIPAAVRLTGRWRHQNSGLARSRV